MTDSLDITSSPETTSFVELIVVTLNDFPVGVYSSLERAEAARQEYLRKLGEPYPGLTMKPYFNAHRFVLDAPATL